MKDHPHTSPAFHAIAILIVAIWGTTFIATKLLIAHGLSPQEIFVLRFIIAYAGIWLLPSRRLWADSLKDEGWLALAGITGGSFYFLTENTALELTLASNVSFIVCTAPLLTALLVLAADKRERATRGLIGGSLLALAGVALVVYNGSFVLKISPIGDLLSLLAALSWAFYSLIIKKVAGHYSSAFITRKVFFYGLLTILPAFVMRPWHFPLEQLARPVVLGNLLFLGVVASLGCYVVWNVVLKRLGTVRTSNYIYLNPLFTLICSSLMLHERLTPIALVGTFLILGGVYLAGKGTTGPE
ncbi:MAG: DMT family transporter [Bacteroides sp.]|nr:DMT family transporter [Bacteroides sp.]